MKISDMLIYFRKNNKQNQKEAGNKFFSPSMYSKIETEKQQLKFDDLSILLSNLSISSSELIIYSDLYSEQKKFISDFQTCAEKPKSKRSKEIILSYYSSLQKNSSLTTRELANLVSIKCSFAPYIPSIKFTVTEIGKIYSYLMKRSFFSQYDFSIIRNMSIHFSLEQIDTLLYKMFPLDIKCFHWTITQSKTNKF